MMLTIEEEDIPNGSLPSRPFVAGTQPVSDWVPAEVDTNDMLNQADPGSSWRHYSMGAPMHTHFPGYSQAPPGAPVWAPGQSESVAREDVNWAEFQPPVRSASYSGGSISNQHHGPYITDTHGSADHRGAAGFQTIYPPPMPSVEGAPGTVLVDPNTMPSGMMPQGNWQNPTNNSNSTMPHPNVPDNYENWGYVNRNGGQTLQANGRKLSGPETEGHDPVYYS